MFYFDNFYGKKILKSDKLADYDCFFTTREFVLTPSNRNDLEQETEKNRHFLEEKLNSSIITAKQTHSANIEIIDGNSSFYEDTDGLISNIPNSLMLLNFADCVPVILYSKKDNAGAVVHAGWRGTAKRIVQKTVEKMKTEFGINPQDIYALIGPAIGKCCFETGLEVFEEFIKTDTDERIYKKNGDKYFIDLKLLNSNQMAKAGVQNIDICDYCTCCMSDIFFSYRKEKGITARHSAVVKIKGENICQ